MYILLTSLFDVQTCLYIYINHTYILFQIGGMSVPEVDEIELKLETVKKAINIGS